MVMKLKLEYINDENSFFNSIDFLDKNTFLHIPPLCKLNCNEKNIIYIIIY